MSKGKNRRKIPEGFEPVRARFGRVHIPDQSIIEVCEAFGVKWRRVEYQGNYGIEYETRIGEKSLEKEITAAMVDLSHGRRPAILDNQNRG